MAVEYIRAIEKPECRQLFLDEIDLDYASPYVDKLCYINRIEKPFFTRDTLLMETKPSRLTKFGIKGTKSKIYVYPSAFDIEWYPVLNDFLTTLIDHEGYHAKEIYVEPRKLINPIWNDFLDVTKTSFSLIYTGIVKNEWTLEKLMKEAELRALMNLKENLHVRNTSLEYRERIRRKIKRTVGN